ncbi:hypothetical protein IEQ34_004961 [Dendrobium chrysotoxum]|uniref:Uncharacterized protein n=1 Tax=Dendrobium chrysotoxum TaxID=161865 RepID=A0AAV7HBB3_DENCH|nr:hypothetical protein IEQ34_004961 [Dendrobium chrysotoxum]
MKLNQRNKPILTKVNINLSNEERLWLRLGQTVFIFYYKNFKSFSFATGGVDDLEKGWDFLGMKVKISQLLLVLFLIFTSKNMPFTNEKNEDSKVLLRIKCLDHREELIIITTKYIKRIFERLHFYTHKDKFMHYCFSSFFQMVKSIPNIFPYHCIHFFNLKQSNSSYIMNKPRKPSLSSLSLSLSPPSPLLSLLFSFFSFPDKANEMGKEFYVFILKIENIISSFFFFFENQSIL